MWIEVVSRDGHVYARERIAGDEARVGRAFDNDVVVDDPHVAPHHLRIYRGEDGELVAEDLGTMNGLYAEHRDERVGSMSLARAPGLRIGRTVLRIHDSAHPVAAELPLAPPRAHVSWALGIAAFLLVFTLLIGWLETTAELSPSRIVLPPLAIAVVVGLWSGFWALLSRIFSGQAHFAAMMRIALTGTLALTFWQLLAEWLSFALAWRDIGDLQSLGGWAILVATCYAHLRAMGTRHMGAAMGLVVGLVATGAGLQYLGKSESRKWVGQRATLGILKPPAMRIVPAAEAEDFFRGTELVKQRVDASRTKEPPASGLIPELEAD